MTEILTDNNENDTLDLKISLMEDKEMRLAKFVNHSCMWLYTYVDNDIVEHSKTMNENSLINLINTPIELYESEDIAKYIVANIKSKKLIAFSIDVSKNVYDELDLLQEEKIKKSNKDIEYFRKNAYVIRHLNSYGKTTETKHYVSYTLQNKISIKYAIPSL